MNPNKLQDVRMGQRVPEDNFFAELLEVDGQNRIQSG